MNIKIKQLVLILLAGTVAVACSNSDDAILSNPSMMPEPPPEIELRALAASLMTQRGELQGVVRAEGRIVHFQGIPYAAAPVGERRWAPPVAAEAWTGTLDASAPSAACVQGDSTEEAIQSEDCLYLNIAVPTAQPDAALAVMVWFHGGGDENGSGHEVIYDLPGLADATGNIVVSVNSRLGFLGFMALPELRAETADGSTGNYHHLDQLMALQWVRDNISDYNGDVSRVTIFGESAGGNDVCRHLSSRLSDGLFQRAILQSSTCGPSTLSPVDERFTQGEFFKQTWGCDDSADALACMRGQDAVALRAALDAAGKAGDLLGGGLLDQARFRPIAAIDAAVFTATPDVALREGSSDVEVIMGVNLNEFTFFQIAAANDNPENNLASYQQVLRNTLTGISDSDVDTLTNDLYPCADYATCSDAFSDLMGDAVFACPSIASAEGLADNGNSVYFYEFTQPINDDFLISFAIDAVDANAPDLGIPHSAELFYLWNLPVLQAGATPAATVKVMQDYWGSFARDGEPMAETGISWPLYSRDSADFIELGETLSLRNSFKRERCDFINSRQLGQG